MSAADIRKACPVCNGVKCSACNFEGTSRAYDYQQGRERMAGIQRIHTAEQAAQMIAAGHSVAVCSGTNFAQSKLMGCEKDTDKDGDCSHCYGRPQVCPAKQWQGRVLGDEQGRPIGYAVESTRRNPQGKRIQITSYLFAETNRDVCLRNVNLLIETFNDRRIQPEVFAAWSE